MIPIRSKKEVHSDYLKMLRGKISKLEAEKELIEKDLVELYEKLHDNETYIPDENEPRVITVISLPPL